MHLADDAKANELRLKGAPGGKTCAGPEGPPASSQDREVVTFDGRVLLRWMDSEVASRYGTAVYVCCGARLKGDFRVLANTTSRNTRAAPTGAPIVLTLIRSMPSKAS
jgi:hypothetical protein